MVCFQDAGEVGGGGRREGEGGAAAAWTSDPEAETRSLQEMSIPLVKLVQEKRGENGALAIGSILMVLSDQAEKQALIDIVVLRYFSFPVHFCPLRDQEGCLTCVGTRRCNFSLPQFFLGSVLFCLICDLWLAHWFNVGTLSLSYLGAMAQGDAPL